MLLWSTYQGFWDTMAGIRARGAMVHVAASSLKVFSWRGAVRHGLDVHVLYIAANCIIAGVPVYCNFMVNDASLARKDHDYAWHFHRSPLCVHFATHCLALGVYARLLWKVSKQVISYEE